MRWFNFLPGRVYFLMWFYYNTAVARNVFHATDTNDPVYTKGIEFGGLTLAYYNIVAFLFALIIPAIAKKLGSKLTHTFVFCAAR